MLKVYILDDEQNAVDGLRAMLQKKFDQRVQIVGYNTHALKAIEELETMDVDILFLDVEMPILNGTEVLRHFPNKSFHVIFTTAHEKYAIPAIKLKVVDYLLKPLSPMDVQEAISRVEEQMKAQSHPTETRITLSVQGSMHIIAVSDIIRIEADSNYSIFYIKDKAKLMVSRTLKEFESQLHNQGFYRVHQSHLINLQHVSGVLRNDGDFVIMTNGDRVELSRRKKVEFLSLIRS